jgi:hypothetical protein
MKERCDFPTQWSDTREIRTLAKVAAMTSQGEVLDPVGSSVLLGENVLDVVREVAVLLRQ